MGKTKDLGHLAHIVAYDGSNHITLPAGITMHTNQLVASQSYVTTALASYALSTSLGSYVPTSRTITINGTTLDLSADRTFTIAAGLTSFNTRTGAVTLTSGDVTTALGFTPYNSTNPSGYITLTSLSAGTGISYNSTTGVITSTITQYTDALARASNSFVAGSGAYNSTTGVITIPTNNNQLTNGAGYITGITSGNVTTALGFTPLSSSGSVTINGDITVGVGTSSNIYMVDTDEGTRQIHCNSNRIGFLTQAGAWGAYCDDAGNWFAANLSGTNTGDQTNISGNSATATNVAWSGVTSKPSHIMYYQSFTLDANTMDVNATGFTYAVNAPHTGPIVRFSAGGNYDLWLNAPYSSGGNSISFRTRNGDTATLNPWREIIHTGNIGSQSVSSATTAGSATFLTSSNYINRAGSTGNANTDFQNTPAGSVRHNGDDAGIGNGAGGSWWFYDNYRHSNASNYWGIQVAWGWEDNANRLATRNVSANSFGGWVYYMNTAAYPYAANMNQYLRTTDEPTFANVYNNGWFRNYGDTGLYNQTHSAHFRRSTSSSYGTWEVFGYNKGGYAGINLIDPSGYWSTLMYENGSGGIYQQNGQSWHMYFFYGNDCLGLSGSETYDWVRACTNGKHRITNDSWCDATSWAYTFSNISDGRLKENIVTVDSALDKVLQLRGVYYNWIIDTENKKHIGLIAQETAAVCPEVVNYHDETDTYSVNYSELSGLFVESTKELNQKLMDANARIELLETKLNQLLNA